MVYVSKEPWKLLIEGELSYFDLSYVICVSFKL